MNDKELDILWKKLRRIPPAWADIYVTFQRLKKASERIEKLEKLDMADKWLKHFNDTSLTEFVLNYEKLEKEIEELKEQKSKDVIAGAVDYEMLRKENAELKFKLGPTNCPGCGTHLTFGENHKCAKFRVGRKA